MELNKQKINLIMAKKRINRHQLAEAYGCTENRISSILNCKDVRPSTAAKFADALGVSIEEIIVNQEAQNGRA